MVASNRAVVDAVAPIPVVVPAVSPTDEAWHTFLRLLPGQAYQLVTDHDLRPFCDQFTEDHYMSSASQSRWTIPLRRRARPPPSRWRIC
jgi:hypothetical protein